MKKYYILALLALVAGTVYFSQKARRPNTEVLAQTQSSDWPQLQHDPQRTGNTNISVVPGSTAKWAWAGENNVTQNFQSQKDNYVSYPSIQNTVIAGDVQPIIVNSIVYFGTANGTFYALNGADGSTVWKQNTGGAYLHTAAYQSGVVVAGNMDHKLYGFDANTGSIKWTFTAEAGFSAAPLVMNDRVFIGSRDGYFYALDIGTGNQLWRYRTIAASDTDPLSQAPIVQPAASDGTRIFFGAENMYFYALDASTGNEIWRKKVNGQSFQYSWPVVKDNLVMTFVQIPDGLSEWIMEPELDSLPAQNTGETDYEYYQRIWPQERQVIRDWLAQNPYEVNFHVFDTSTGNYPFAEQVPMGRVGGFGYPGKAPVIDNQGRILMYWRVRSGTFIRGGTFGTKYTPDISAMDPTSGDRIALIPKSAFGTEIDNNFDLTVGGDQLYLNNHMRGVHTVNLTTGSAMRVTSILAIWDGADFRGWGARIIWLGNDSDSTYETPPSIFRNPQGESGVALATINGVPTMVFSESGHYQINFSLIGAVQ